MPPPGHTFWTTGNVNLTIHFPGSQTFEQAFGDELSLTPVAPTIEVRGARLDRAGVKLLIYERTLRESSVRREAEGVANLDGGPINEAQLSKRRGRTKGAGSYAPMDAPLLAEMKRLIAEQKASSVHHAASMVAERAYGGGTMGSKATRLRRAYFSMERNGAN